MLSVAQSFHVLISTISQERVIDCRIYTMTVSLLPVDELICFVFIVDYKNFNGNFGTVLGPL